MYVGFVKGVKVKTFLRSLTRSGASLSPERFMATIKCDNANRYEGYSRAWYQVSNRRKPQLRVKVSALGVFTCERC